ncbi:hypothetical protein EB796_007119 [Bugula neritina]|uniref:Uncharacterized protein n=1 Tax=Bugula neritina TaxID=10212 RepID=A0A7J7K7H4_BUGNE|nr:hypothetical protein EB796_007119 [Bugula neritina]
MQAMITLAYTIRHIRHCNYVYRCNINDQAECDNSARLHSHDSTSELYYSCTKVNIRLSCSVNLLMQLSLSSRIVLSVARLTPWPTVQTV